jgi:hypothetical protein
MRVFLAVLVLSLAAGGGAAVSPAQSLNGASPYGDASP